ncbi:hypothetical protein B296_00013683 [Ensete ventricosum]|uniref:Uncharacterized protein n=1 Tax=Ensete ventricosum TaxID=4639 RepID=A0A427B842_ENSVE|nr:hypothetical protein B296_00013683 [Ensete ventricosum]
MELALVRGVCISEYCFNMSWISMVALAIDFDFAIMEHRRKCRATKGPIGNCISVSTSGAIACKNTPEQLLVQQNALEHQQAQQLELNNPCLLVCLKIHIHNQKVKFHNHVVEQYQEEQDQEHYMQENGAYGDDDGGANDGLVEEMGLVNWYYLRYLRNDEEKRTNVFALLYQILCGLVQDFLQKSSGLLHMVWNQRHILGVGKCITQDGQMHSSTNLM